MSALPQGEQQSSGCSTPLSLVGFLQERTPQDPEGAVLQTEKHSAHGGRNVVNASVPPSSPSGLKH